ncbi:polyprenol phosphomannose-dependent alpha 1,6 mannosyltransferase MptB [Micromonospora soli]|uniref:polyprenol phosphomannose-dependent alpha 1,6 mannosyltransferase MptB n=1 Tax=Micromonospora sp. NBRC 110009 TaxID=3061627 RepID=UPI002671ED0C|nr:polyprenol phosphomannose-dependent alpha 1,6 mannosyltransferase MptB [Micromonospora sp. NBRC 110009]WKT96383.1 polyprenol phosphomannose-dependent alpha 1,6 mannosyltransferase MptB [Micromonospora sp. NBRC 110009]
MSESGAVPDGPVRPVAADLARYAGLAGATLLTVAGWLGGALPDAPLTTSLADLWHAPHGPWALGCWLAGTLLLVGAWWSLRWGAPSTRWAYLTAGLWLLPLLVAPPLGSRDGYSYVCQGWSWAHGADPYRVGVAAAGCPWTDAVSPIWRDTPAPYGPFFVLLAGLAVLAGGGLVGALVLLRVVAVAGVLLAALCVPGLARACGVPSRRAAWLVLACPLVGVHLVAGAHNDAVGLGLVLFGLLVLVRRPGKPRALVVAGVLLGLAVAVKAVAVVVLPFAALAAVLGRYTPRALLRDAGWLAGGALAALLVTSLGTGLGPGWVGGLERSGDSQQWTSPPTAVGFVVDYAGALFGREPHAVPVARAVALVLLAALLVALWCWAWAALRRLNDVRQRVVRLAAARSRIALTGAGLALAATVLLAPVFHPWYAIWPLALLAVATRSPARTVWFVAPCAVASVLVLPDGTNLARFTKAPGAILMTVLVVAVVVAAVRAGLARRVR